MATLHQADARAMPLPDASVHMCVTSPPYWGLRDYGLGQWQGGDAECGHEKNVHEDFSFTNGRRQNWPELHLGHIAKTRRT